MCSQHDHYLRRLKLQYCAHDNRAGKLLANKLKVCSTKLRIPFTLHPFTKQRLTNPQAIADAFYEYYSALYNLNKDAATPQPTQESINKFLSQIKLLTLPKSQLGSLNAPFSAGKIIRINKFLPAGKSPDPDGFTNEYYKGFADTLSSYLTNIFTEAPSKASFPKEMLTANTITLPKPGKDFNTPANCRPTSLLTLKYMPSSSQDA